MKPSTAILTCMLLAACDGTGDAAPKLSAPGDPGVASMGTTSVAATAIATGVVDGDWSCRAGAALLGTLGIAGSNYTLKAADNSSSGSGRLSGSGDRLSVTSGPLRAELGITSLVYHEGSEYPSLTGMNASGAAMTCFRPE